MSRFKELSKSWMAEYLLIRDIWTDRFPEADMYSLSFLEKFVMISLVAVRSLSAYHFYALFKTTKARSQFSENYVLIWFIALVVLLIYPASTIWYPLVIIYRLVDGFNYRLCIIFVDRYKFDWGLRSLNRSFMLLMVNYLEMIVGFAALYIYTGSIAAEGQPPISEPWEAFYFSVVTITTLGYGDLSPATRTGEILVAAQVSMGVVFILLVVSTFLTGVTGIRNLGDGEYGE